MHVDEDLTEAEIIHDIFVSGLGRIEDVGGGVARFTFFTYQKSTVFKDRRREKVVAARICMPMAEAMAAAKATLIAAGKIEGLVGNVIIERRH